MVDKLRGEGRVDQLQIISLDGQLVTDSRDVAEMTGVRHGHLLEKIDGYVDIISRSTEPKIRLSDFFIESSYQDTTGRTLKCYLLTRKGCDMVANKMTGEKGVLFTAAYVTRFEEMEKKLSHPTDIAKLLLDPDTIIKIAENWKAEQALRIAAESKIEADKPKVIFAEAVTASKSSILVGELAKILKQNGVDTGQQRLFQWLRDNGYLIRRQGSDYNMPTQRSMELGLFEIKETSINHSDGHISVTKTPKVTGKGQVYFVNKFKADLVLAGGK